jgi:hypothetical protein
VATRLADQGASQGADALFDGLAGVTTSPAILARPLSSGWIRTTFGRQRKRSDELPALPR